MQRLPSTVSQSFRVAGRLLTFLTAYKKLPRSTSLSAMSFTARARSTRTRPRYCVFQSHQTRLLNRVKKVPSTLSTRWSSFERDTATNTVKGILLTSQKSRRLQLTAEQRASLTDAAKYIHNPTNPSYILPEIIHLGDPKEVCISA